MVSLVVVLVLAVFGALHWYLWRRLVRDTTARSGVSRRVGTVAFVAAPLLMFAAIAAEQTGAPFLLQQVLAWPGFLWMALTIYLLLALLVGEAVRPLLRRALDRRPAPAAEPADVREAASVPAGAPARDAEQPNETSTSTSTSTSAAVAEAGAEPTPVAAGPSRRLFVSRVVGGAAAVAAVGTVGYGTYGVLNGPKVKRVTVPLAKLPRSAHGYRIAVVSDIHLGPVLGRGFAQKVVDTINSTQPDLIAVVGDLVDGSVKDLGPAAAPLAQLTARHGSFFVTGNHEYFSGAEEWVERVRELGLRPLENARTELAHFDLAGVNDVAGEDEGQGPDFAKALGDRDRSRTCVLLAHQPVQIHDAVDHGVDLQLSGHTHGGQLWPGNFIADLANPTLAGLERYGDTQLYVSRGAGAWGPPTRVGAPSDITVVELASKQA
ncbi:metallophosphoesterase [Streptomyces aurantiacus]|uniref:metallophosphoesterase n=1 Tax=Streptomyces aurantiacus TaxID=47760 RepID=UPI001684B962|nr:metallophosphoesterase [Streptomyces aurantiacus]